jgi:hypothetical protein
MALTRSNPKASSSPAFGAGRIARASCVLDAIITLLPVLRSGLGAISGPAGAHGNAGG